MCKPLKPSVISFMLTKNRFLAYFFSALAVLNFALKMRRKKQPLGRGTSRDSRKSNCRHMSSTAAVTSRLHFTAQHLIILNLNFSSLSKVPKSIPFCISKMSHGTLQRKLSHQDKLQVYIQAQTLKSRPRSRLTPFSGASAVPNSKTSTEEGMKKKKWEGRWTNG